jgi:hypothetical protein
MAELSLLIVCPYTSYYSRITPLWSQKEQLSGGRLWAECRIFKNLYPVLELLHPIPDFRFTPWCGVFGQHSRINFRWFNFFCLKILVHRSHIVWCKTVTEPPYSSTDNSSFWRQIALCNVTLLPTDLQTVTQSNHRLFRVRNFVLVLVFIPVFFCVTFVPIIKSVISNLLVCYCRLLCLNLCSKL